jgi:ribose transport system ATP-binding protein
VLANGAAVLPAARELKSIAAMSVRENLTLPNLTPMWSRGLFRVGRERVLAKQLTERFDIRPRDPERMLATLSGGNQQKVCVAKWLRDRPNLIVLDEPTAGVDVGGRADILGLLVEISRQGIGVLICSSDLDDLAEICSRVVVVRHGRATTELVGGEITRDHITTECYRSDVNDV